MEQVRHGLIRIVADPKVTVKCVDNGYRVFAQAPDSKSFPAGAASGRGDATSRARYRHHVAQRARDARKWRPERRTASIRSRPAFRAMGCRAWRCDQDDVRAHGKDKRVRVSSFYDGVEFYYRYLKALTEAR